MKRLFLLAGGLAVALSLLLTFLHSEKAPLPAQRTAATGQEEKELSPLSGARADPLAPELASASVPSDPETVMSSTVLSLSDIPEGEFKAGVVRLPEEAQRRALEKLDRNRQLLADVESLRVDPNGMIYYVCTFGAESGAAARSIVATAESATAGIEPAGALVPVASPPQLHSRPGSANVLFLDFNGHVIEGTAWNSSKGVAKWECLPYDKDGDRTTFSSAEMAIITQVWERVSEDYAPFDVDVTTEEPVWGTRTGHALITPTTDKNGVPCPHSGYGGIAYLDVFGNSWYSYNYGGNCYSPAWCIDYVADDAAEVISHELGHNLSLSHDMSSDLSTYTNGYYAGHVNGGIPWGPIMGTGYNDDVSQWSKGDYYNAFQSSQDDLYQISSRLGYRPDDHGDTLGAADALSADAFGYLAEDGVIETTGDPDAFVFTVDEGAVDIMASPYRAANGTWGGNLDINLELYNGIGTLMATNNPILETKASFSTNLAAGTYYLQVKPTGMGNPLVNPPTGYVLYGSLGQYSVRVVPPGGIKALPNIDGFEGGGGSLWRQSTSDDIDWTSQQGTTPSGSTGPSGAASGSYYLFTEASSQPNKTAMIESTRLDLEHSTLPTLMFEYHMYGADMGTLSVDVFDGTWHSNVWVRSGQQHTSSSNPWSTAVVDLSPFAGMRDVVIRLRGKTGGNYRSDMAIDNLRFSVDADADTMPDYWENLYFGSITGAVAAVDTDNDGFDNLAEYIAGSIPTDDASFFMVTEQAMADTTNFVVEWAPSLMGRIYTVMWNADLVYGSFSNISGDLPYPAGSYTDTVERVGNGQFYRVEVRLDP